MGVAITTFVVEFFFKAFAQSELSLFWDKNRINLGSHPPSLGKFSGAPIGS
jgi:hypothetical protein